MSLNRTPNYDLYLPEYTDDADVAILNQNATLIDGILSDIEDEVDTKMTQPTGGTDGQALLIDDNGQLYWGSIPTSASEMQEYVDDWLDDHPEATTTVEDGSISFQKLNSDMQSRVTHTISFTDDGNGNVTLVL